MSGRLRRTRPPFYLCTRPPQSASATTFSRLSSLSILLPSHAPAGSPTVLLVEDEEMVRSFIRKVLHREGYTVLEAADPDEALRFAEQHESPIHLLLADIALPWMRGTELFQRFSPHHPETRVIYMSGYTREAIGPCPLLAAGEGFLQKPFSPGALLNTVREVLAR